MMEEPNTRQIDNECDFNLNFDSEVNINTSDDSEEFEI